MAHAAAVGQLQKDDPDLIRLLIKYGASTSVACASTCLHWACDKDKEQVPALVTVISLFLTYVCVCQSICSCWISVRTNLVDEDGNTPIMLLNHDPKLRARVIKYCNEHGIKVTLERDFDDATQVHHEQQHTQMIAAAQANDVAGVTAILEAVR